MTAETQSVPSIFPQVLDEDRKPHLCILMNTAGSTSLFKFRVVYLGLWALCFCEEPVTKITLEK